MGRPPLTRALVVDRTRALVRADGVGGISLRSVARDLGVTAPALYAYVTDYDDLLAAVAETEFRRLRDRFSAVGGDDPVERIREMIRVYVAHACEEPHLHRLMFRYAPQVPVAAVEPTFGPATDTFAAARAPVDEAIAAGRLTVIDPVLASLTLWSAAHGVAEVLLMGFDFPEDVARDLVESVIAAVVGGMCRDVP
jgi:AcrR family transcriptional regulator